MKTIFTSIFILMFVFFQGVNTYADDTLFNQLFNGEENLVIKTTTTAIVKKPTNISEENIKIIDKNFGKMKNNLIKYSIDKRIELYSIAIKKINKLIILRKTIKERSILNYLKDLINAELGVLETENGLLKELFGDSSNSICSSDYIYSNGDCIKKEITDTQQNGVSKKICYVSNGYGNQFWYSTYWSKCYVINCNEGYYLYNGYCTKNYNTNYNNNCSSNEHYENGYCVSNIRYCNISNGYGKQTWNGSYWGTCYAQDCNSIFYLSNGYCVKNTNYYNYNCYGYDTHYENGYCVSNTRYCNINNGYGKQTWNGNSWGTCYAEDCNSGYYLSNGNCTKSYNCSSNYHYENNNCISNTRSCYISNGSGTQTWNGNYWNNCYATSCNNGYYLSNGNCTSNYNNCSNDQHFENNSCVSNIRSCSINNGSGTQIWNGNYWNNCYATSCNNGYHISNGSCISN